MRVRFLLALLTGTLLALSFPTAGLSFLIFIAFVPLVLAARSSRSIWEAFLLGTFSYALTWLINVPWVVHVMSYYGGLPLPTGVAIYIAMAFYLGIFGGFFAVAVFLMRLDTRGWRWLGVPAAWAAAEYGRTYMFSGFPWNLIAESTVSLRPLAQLGSLIGSYGVAFILASFSAILGWALVVRTRRSIVTAATISALVLAASLLTGEMLLRSTLASMEKVPSHLAAMIQPNITQEMRWDSANLLSIFERTKVLTDQAVERKSEVVLWPESTLPVAFMTTPFWRDYIEQISRDHHIDVILGSLAEDPADDTKLWNAAYLIHEGSIAGRYDKMRLVPFGEYVPLRKYLFFAQKLVRAVGEFQFGTKDVPLSGKYRYGPAICYEITYPRIAALQVERGAEVLITITNDAWFGDSSAPRQHLDAARLRAIETGRYILRAGTTGISAVIDPTGRIQSELALNQEGVLVDRFSTRHSITPYVRFGDWPAVVSILALIPILITRKRVSSHE
ncbi:MAG TPA: apolipoprotein N-acyltransferase [Thermoanaerobaculia bacterium]|nr:apolipoprotein N-acyltransferase [Thermoanaerobaculia bacterium]